MPRVHSIPAKPLTEEEMQISLRLQHSGAYDALERLRPRTRADCARVPRPCPFLLCRYNLAVDVNEDSGSFKIARPRNGRTESCALDVAEAGGVTLEEAGDMLGCTRERTRQIEAKAKIRLFDRVRALEVVDKRAPLPAATSPPTPQLSGPEQLPPMARESRAA